MADERNDADLGGDHARDTHRGGLGDDYAREKDLEAIDKQPEDKPKDDVKIGKASE
ncbi:MAG TPA: hypothetical protein VII12_14935 [Thermoanaerobaculia bacterium]